MRLIEIIIDGESTTYNVDAFRGVSKESSNVFESCFWVSMNVYPLEPIRLLLADENTAEKFYLSIKAFMKSDSDKELIIQLKKGDGRANKLVAIQTIEGYKNH